MHRLDDLHDLGGLCLKDRQAVAEHFHAELRADAGDRLVESHRHRGREVVVEPRDLAERRVHLDDQRVDRLGLPLVARVEDHVDVARIQAHRLGRELGPPQLGDDAFDLGEAQQRPLHVLRDRQPLRQRRAGKAARLDEHRTLVEFRHELGAEERDRSQRQDEHSERRAEHRAPPFERAREVDSVARADPLQPAAGLLRHVRQEERRQHGHIGEREYERAEHGDGHRECHRREHPPLEPLEREDRQVDGDDDAYAEHDRPAYFERGAADDLAPRGGRDRAGVAQPAHEILHHHHRRIDDEAEVERAKAHQVRRHAESLHRHEGEEQRQRDHGGRDQRRADVSQEEKQHEHDEQPALEQVLEHRPRRAVHDVALVVERADRHTARKQWLNHDEARLDQVNDFLSVRSLEHHDHPRERFPPRIAGDGSFARHRSHAHGRHVAHVHRCSPGTGAHDDVADVRGVGEPPEATHGQALSPRLDVAGAEVAVIRLQRRPHIAERQSVAGKSGGIGEHVKLLHHAAPRVHIGHPR